MSYSTIELPKTFWYILTMFAKNPIPIMPNDPDYSGALEFLYAQRSRLDTLIETLEQYAQFKTNSDQPRTHAPA